MFAVRILFLLAAALAAIPSSASSAWAAPDKSAQDAEASARDHFQRGQRLSAAGDFAGAYREFAAGYALTERPLFLFNMGEAARAGGQLEKARADYRRFLERDPKNSLAATAKARLAELDRALAAAPAPTAPTAPAPTLPSPSTPPPSVVVQSPDRFATATRDEGGRPPLYKYWPFWAAVGGVVAGSVVIYAVSAGGSSPCGEGCTEVDFR